MSYSPSTDFLALLRKTPGGVRTLDMPGLDMVVAALARAGLINLVISSAAPLANQATTAWFQPASPSWGAEGRLLLWNGASYQAATPALWALFLQAAGPASVKILIAPGPYTALPSDQVLIVKQTVGALFTINVDWSQRVLPLRVVDGKGDAAVNNILIDPAPGQTQLALANFVYVIDGNGGSVTLTPLPDGTGAY